MKLIETLQKRVASGVTAMAISVLLFLFGACIPELFMCFFLDAIGLPMIDHSSPEGFPTGFAIFLHFTVWFLIGFLIGDLNDYPLGISDDPRAE